MLYDKRWNWDTMRSPKWILWWVRMIPINSSCSSSLLIMRPLTYLPTWLCLLLHFLLYYVQYLHWLDFEVIVFLLGIHKPFIINFIDLDIFFQSLMVSTRFMCYSLDSIPSTPKLTYKSTNSSSYLSSLLHLPCFLNFYADFVLL